MDQVYRVLVRYEGDGEHAKKEADSLSEKLEHLKHWIEAAFAVEAIKGFIEKTIELGSEVENTRIQLAGMMTAAGAPGASDFNRSLSMSSQLIDDMREASAKLPGTWQDLAKIVTTNIVPGLKAGLSVTGLRELGGQMQALFLPQGMAAPEIGNSLLRMLTGTVRQIDPIFVRLGAVMGKSAKEFNLLPAQQRLELIQQALAKFDPAMKAYANSWMAVSTTTRNYAQLVFERLTDKLFDGLKGGLARLNAWFEANKQRVFELAEAVGTKLANAFRTLFGWGVKVVGFLSDHWNLIKLLVSALGSAIAIWKAYELTMKVVTAAQWLWNIAMMANPIGIIVAALAALIAAIVLAVSYIDDLKDSWVALVNDPAFSKVAGKIGLPTPDRPDVWAAKAAETRMAQRAIDLQQNYGGTGIGAHLKALFDKTGITNFKKPGENEDPSKEQKKSKSALDSYLLSMHGNVKQGNTNVQVTIKQDISTSEDPQAILVKTREALAQALDKALKHPIENPGQPFTTLRY